MESLGSFSDWKVSNHGNEAEVSLLASDTFVANAVRRTMISSIRLPAFYVENLCDNGENAKIRIETNRSALHNEILKHRIMLLPIYHLEHEPDAYQFLLTANSHPNKMIEVTTGDISGTVQGPGDSNPRILTRQELDKIFRCPSSSAYILITKLRPKRDEELRISMRLSEGDGKIHATFSPVTKCVYYNLLDETKVAEKRAQLTSENARKQFDVHDQYRLFQCDREGASAFRFSLESVGQMRVAKILEQALVHLETRVRTLLDDPSARQFSITKNIEGRASVDIRCPGLCHTLGNLIQGFLYRNAAAKKIAYIGYHKPHPLDDLIVFRMVPTSEESLVPQCRSIMDENLRSLLGKIRDLRETLTIAQNLGGTI